MAYDNDINPLNQSSGIIQDDEPYLIAFSGGGAKGLVHIGAFHHLHDTQKNIASVAGTSAGAIIATLISAGYKPDELLDKQGNSPLWDAAKKEIGNVVFLSDALGAKQYGHLTQVFERLRNKKWVYSIWSLFGVVETRRFFIVSIATYIISIIACLALLQSELISSLSAFFIAVMLGTVIPLTSIALYLFFLKNKVGSNFEKGVCNLHEIEKIIEFALQQKLRSQKGGSPVKFSELTKIPLKVVATDVTNSQPKIFSTEATPDASVAKAVAASICLPYVFSAQSIDSDLYYDGGIVSNLPAWVFEEERLVSPNLRIIAFSVQEIKKEKPEKQEKTSFERLMASLLSAHQSIGLRSLVDLKEVVLKTDLNLLSFKFNKEDAAKIIEQGQESSAIVDDIYTAIPDLYCDLAYRIRLNIASSLSDVLKKYGASQPRQSAKRLRVAFAVQEPYRPGLMWIKFSSGFRNSKDRGIMIPVQTSTAGLAFIKENPVLTIMGKSTEGVLNGPADGYIRGVISQKIKWIIGVPVMMKVAVSDDNNSEALTVQKKIVMTVDGFDDIFSNLPSGFSEGQDEWNNVVLEEVCRSIGTVLHKHIEKTLPSMGKLDLDVMFPSLENAASKHI